MSLEFLNFHPVVNLVSITCHILPSGNPPKFTTIEEKNYLCVHCYIRLLDYQSKTLT